MSVIQDSVDNISDLFRRWKQPDERPETFVTNLLIDLRHYCDATPGVSWLRCNLAADRQHHKEVRERADATPLD